MPVDAKLDASCHYNGLGYSASCNQMLEQTIRLDKWDRDRLDTAYRYNKYCDKFHFIYKRTLISAII